VNADRLISRLAPVSDDEAAALVSERAAWELADQIVRTDPGQELRRGALTSDSILQTGRLRQPADPILQTGPGRRRRVRWPALTVVAAVAAAAVVAVAVLAQHPAGLVHPPRPKSSASAATVATPAQLAAQATLLASRHNGPGPSQWVYAEVLSTRSRSAPGGLMAQIPGTRQTSQTWTKAGGQASAVIQHGRVIVSSILGSPVGWPQLSYRYLHSLPVNPTRLLRLIRHNLRTLPSPFTTGAGDPQVFTAVAALIENNPELPPRLSAALYGVLAELPSVRLGHATDLAGQRMLSLYQTQDGYLRQQIFINPVTYAYAGQLATAIHAYAGRVRRGEILADQAILSTQIVNGPGQR
jgi:hypothetical protein